MTYRSDTDALAARLGDLERDLADRTRERDEVAQMLAEARDREHPLDEPVRRRRFIVASVATTLFVVGGLLSFALVRHDAPRVPDDAIVMQIERYAHDMCKCTDKLCAYAVDQLFAEWGQEMAKQYENARQPDAELLQRAAPIVQRYTDCMNALSGGGPLEIPSLRKTLPPPDVIPANPRAGSGV